MDTIRIQNLRSLEDTGPIDIKPITVLVGQNSSGKSTFLRTFPLLKQSIEERTAGPVLWYGRFVDFGSFAEAVNIHSDEKEIVFEFNFVLSPEFRLRFRYRNFETRDKEVAAAKINLKVKIQTNKSNDEGYIGEIEVELNNREQYCLKADSKGNVTNILINGKSDFSYIRNAQISTNSLIPWLRIRETANREKIIKTVLDSIKNDESLPFDLRQYLPALILTQISNWEDDRTYHLNYDENILGSVFNNNMPDGLSTEYSDEIKIFLNNLSLDQLDMLQASYRLSAFASLLRDAQIYVNEYFKASTYIAPIRAIAERFYRPQNLSVEDVDFQGKNLAVFLRSFTTLQMKEFNEWTEKHFNFSAFIQSGGGHLSVRIKEGGEDRNLADTGFGYSQVIPIVTQLWSLIKSRNKNLTLPTTMPITYLIEQPELHLHPRMQAGLADAFVDAVKMSRSEKVNLNLIIETHSEAIINRLGHRIIRGDISPEQINIVIFDKEKPGCPTKITTGTYSKDGFLTNWPYGFFEPDYEG